MNSVIKPAHEVVIDRVAAPSHDEIDSVADWIHAAMRHDIDGQSGWDVCGRLARGEYGLLVVYVHGEIQAVVAVTARISTVGVRALHVVACGGAMLDVWLDKVLDELRSWAQDSNCQRITLCGREGWERVLRHRGYKRASTLMVQELSE